MIQFTIVSGISSGRDPNVPIAEGVCYAFLMTKPGAIHESTFKEVLFVDGHYYDKFRFSLHENQYRELHLHFLDRVEE